MWEQPQVPRIRPPIFRFIGLKQILIVFALIGIAMVFWLPQGRATEKDLFVPVQLGQTPTGLIVTEIFTKGFEIRLKGSRARIGAVTRKKPVYRLDLSQAEAGVMQVTIDLAQMKLPDNLQVTEINPPMIRLKIEREINKVLPVKTVLTGKPAPGFQVAGVAVTPSTVVVRGPENTLAVLSSITTKPLDVSGLDEPQKKEIALNLPENLSAHKGPVIILAQIDIAAKVITQSFAGIIVTARNTSYKTAITPAAVDIRIKGPQQTLAQLAATKSIDVFVDLKNHEPGVYVRRATIRLPVNTTLVGSEPELFTVTLTKP